MLLKRRRCIVNISVMFGSFCFTYFRFLRSYSSAGDRRTQPIARSSNRDGRDARMSRGILSEIYQLLGQKPDENADGRVRLCCYYVISYTTRVKRRE